MKRIWLLGLGMLLSGFFFSKISLSQPHIQAPPPPRPAILEFSRELCPMCEYMHNILERLKAKYGDQIQVRILHIDTDQKYFRNYNVVFVPTQIFLNVSGEEVFRHNGVLTLPELENKLQQLNLLKNP